MPKTLQKTVSVSLAGSLDRRSQNLGRKLAAFDDHDDGSEDDDDEDEPLSCYVD